MGDTNMASRRNSVFTTSFNKKVSRTIRLSEVLNKDIDEIKKMLSDLDNSLDFDVNEICISALSNACLLAKKEFQEMKSRSSHATSISLEMAESNSQVGEKKGRDEL